MDRSTDPRTGTPATTPRTRDVGVDAAKGIAIVLIVTGHVLRGDAAAGLVAPDSTAYLEADSALYLVHLSVFAVLAGLYTGPPVEREGARPWLRRRVLTMTWLYVVWTVVQGAVKVLTATLVNDPMSPSDVLVSLVRPTSQLWWLGFVVVMSVAAGLVRPWRGGRALLVSTAVVALTSVVFWGEQGTWVLLQGLGLAGFFWAGAITGRAGWDRVTARAGLLAVVGAVVLTTSCVLSDPVPPTSWVGPRPPLQVVLGIVASVTGTLGVLGLAVLAARTVVGPVLAVLGRRSLEIFLAHITATAGCRIVLVRLGVTDLVPQITLGVAAGLTFPLLLWWAGERVHAPWLFRPPAALVRRGAVSARG